MAMCPATFVVPADHRVRHLTRMRVRARDDRVWGETLRGGCPGQDSNLHGSCLPWDLKLGPAATPSALVVFCDHERGRVRPLVATRVPPASRPVDTILSQLV